MMRKLLLSFLFCTCMNTVFAQEKSQKPLLTPFTGTDYVRLVVDADHKKPNTSFKVIIKAVADDKVLYQGAVTPAQVTNAGRKQLTFTVKNLKPVLWEPNNPYLYYFTLQQLSGGKVLNSLTERGGFRFFERKGGSLYLNGKPIFLRGIAINPPGRGIPSALERSREFALEYVKFMKSINVNIIRIQDVETWYDVCDELGMMVFGGNYDGKVAKGAKVEKQEQVGDEGDGGFPKDHDVGLAWYEHEKLGLVAHHPSLMVYAMTNETPFTGKRFEEWNAFLTYAYNNLKKWDETRVYIANAGYGYGLTGDICDLHRYWGWYYSSPYTFLNIRSNAKIIPFPKSNQPITFSECVGNYTGPDGRYNQTPAHKNPSSQLAWTGHERQDMQAQLADVHQSFTFRQAAETFRQMRAINPDLSGLFPFTIMFYNWDTIEKFGDMKPKPVTEQTKLSYQPVLLSWECWTGNVYAGATVKPIAHIINDDNGFADLKNVKIVYQLLDRAKTAVFSDSVNVSDVPYYATSQTPLTIHVPDNLSTGEYTLSGKVFANGKEVSKNFFNLFVAAKTFTNAVPPITSTVLVYDGKGQTKQALAKLNVAYKEISTFASLPTNNLLLIGENAADKTLADNAALIKEFIKKGGRVVALRQDSLHRVSLNNLLDYKMNNTVADIDNPAYPLPATPPRNGFYLNPERPEHPVFSGIKRDNLKVWSDYTNWNPKQEGFPMIYPVTDGFQLENWDGIGATAVLANYSSGLQSIALAEQFMGNGSVLLSGLDLVNRAGLDPIASRLLLNMLSYGATADGHSAYQLITAPIIWGEYETEKGILNDNYSGFLSNATPRITPAYAKGGIVVTKEGYQLAGGNRGLFNTRPGLQYVTNGRRPWGTFVQTFGGQPRKPKGDVGTAKFWCSVPQGQNNMASLVWNPSAEPLTFKIKVNDLPEVTYTINPGERTIADAPVDNTNVGVTYMGDRRLVVLETSFSKK